MIDFILRITISYIVFIYFLLPKEQGNRPFEIGLKCFAWVGFISAFVPIPESGVEYFARSALSALVFGAIAFCIGFIYGKFATNNSDYVVSSNAKPNSHVGNSAMKKTTKLRLIGGAILFFNLAFAGRYDIVGFPLLLLTIGFVIAYEYLLVRPAANKEENLGNEITENIPDNYIYETETPVKKPLLYKVVINEDKIYADIADELETGNTDKGLWTRLFAESDGDERKTKALYIKRRVERLIAAEKLSLQQEHAALKQLDEIESLDESQIQPLIQEEAQPIKQLTPKEIKDREAIRDRLAESIRLNKIQNANSANSSSTQQKYDQETINLIKKYVRTIEARNATYETYDRFLYLIGGNIEAKGFLFGSYHIVTYKGFKTRMNNFLDIISWFETNVLPDFKNLQNLDVEN